MPDRSCDMRGEWSRKRGTSLDQLCTWSALYLDRRCQDQLCLNKLCLNKLCLNKLCLNKPAQGARQPDSQLTR
jgi:hypothetical protein